jgi:hypothetical protein
MSGTGASRRETAVADDEIDPALVDALLRWQRGQGPRPDVPADREDLLAVLAAVVDSAEIVTPPFDEDPVARRLGLADATGNALLVSLRELAHRLGGELDVEEVTGEGAVRAVGRTLAERIVVLAVDDDDLATGLDRAATVFTRQPGTTAVALVSPRSLLAVVVTEADSVRAIDPLRGWTDPRLPRDAEPFPIALGRHLERTRPRWDEIAHLDDMLVFAPDPDEVAGTIGRVVAERLGRPVRIPARRTALESLHHLTADTVGAVVDDVRAGRLAGDDLLDRIRVLAGAGAT